MSKSIEKFLPEKGPERPVQGNIPDQVFEKVSAWKEKKNLTWSEVLTAMFKRHIEETKL